MSHMPPPDVTAAFVLLAWAKRSPEISDMADQQEGACGRAGAELKTGTGYSGQSKIIISLLMSEGRGGN
jgi:hypothetical protein